MATPHLCALMRNRFSLCPALAHLHEVKHEDQEATPAVQAVQVGVALLPVVVKHRHQAW